MPQRKNNVQTLIVQIVLVVSLLALVGNFSVNFWERYIIQNELGKMKTSLHALKDTINYINLAYNQLHNELQGVANVAEDNNTLDRQKHNIIAEKLLQDLEIQTCFESGMKTEKQFPKHDFSNGTTSCHLHVDKIDESIGTKDFRNKKLQAPHIKNVQTITRNPLKSKAAGNNINELQNFIYSPNSAIKHTHKHKCNHNKYCSPADPENDYSRF